MNFEKVFDEHKEELTQALVFFGEGVRVNKLLADEEVKRPEYYKFYEKGYEAGQQSRQSEIDMLKKRIEDTEKWIEDNKKYIAIGHWEGWTDEQYVDADDLLDILKGESYDC